MKQHNVLLIEGLDIQGIKDMLTNSLFFDEDKDVVIYHTDDAKKFWVALPDTLSSIDFLDLFAFTIDFDTYPITQMRGWYKDDGHIFGAQKDETYMAVLKHNSDGNSIALIVDKADNNYLDCSEVDEDNIDENGYTSPEEEQFYEQWSEEGCTSMCKTKDYKEPYIPCDIPTTAKCEVLCIEKLEVNTNSLSFLGVKIFNGITFVISLIFLNPYVTRIFGTKIPGAVALGVSLIINACLTLAVLAAIAVPVFLGYGLYSDTVTDPQLTFLDCSIITLGIGLFITIFKYKGIKWTEEYLTDLIVNTVAVVVAGGFACLVVFGLNKYVGGEDDVKIRTAVTVSESTGKSGTTYRAFFFLPVSQEECSYGLGGDDSYLDADSCTVTYHKGCLGWHVVDGIEH